MSKAPKDDARHRPEPEDEPPTTRHPSGGDRRGPDGFDDDELGAPFQDDIPTAYEESRHALSEEPPAYKDSYAVALSGGDLDEDGPDLVEDSPYPDAVSTVGSGPRPAPGLVPAPTFVEDGPPDTVASTVGRAGRVSARASGEDTASFGAGASSGELSEELLEHAGSPSRADESLSLEVDDADIVEAVDDESPSRVSITTGLDDADIVEAIPVPGWPRRSGHEVDEDAAAPDKGLEPDEDTAAFELASVGPFGEEDDEDLSALDPFEAADGEGEEVEAGPCPGEEDEEEDYAEVDDGPTITSHVGAPDVPHPSGAGDVARPDERSDLSRWAVRAEDASELDELAAYESTAVAFLDGSSSVTAPSFDEAVRIVDEEDPERARALSTEVVSKLRTGVTSVSSLVAGDRRAAPPTDAHRELDPRPFVESLRRNPGDRAALNALHRIYTATERWDELVGLLLEASEAERSASRRLELLCELGDVLAERLNEPEKAQMALISALLLEPRSEEVAVRLSVVTARGELWATLFSELGGAAAQEAHAGRRAALCARIGEWYLRAGHPAYAAPCFEQALVAVPGELRALLGMAAIFEQVQDLDHLAEVVASLPPAPPPGTPSELLLRLALLQERAENEAAALTALEEVLESDPGNEEVLEVLERLLGRQGRFGELAGRLASRAEAVAVVDPEGAAELWRRVARLHLEQVGDLRVAERACRAALELEHDDRQSLEALEGIFAQSSRWPELAWVLEQQLGLTPSSRERVALLARLAELEEEEFLQPEAAARRYADILELDPRNEEAQDRLTGLLRRLGRWGELVGCLERRVLTAADDPARSRLFTEAGRILAEELGELERASLHLRRSRRLDATNLEALSLLASILERSGVYEEAYEAQLEISRVAGEPEARAEALVRAAAVARDGLGRRDEAVELLEQAVSLDPGRRDAAEALRRERVASEDWRGAARALEVEIEQARSSAQRGRLLVELGSLLRERLGRDDEAAVVLESAREALGEVREVVEPLFDLYVALDRKEDAARLAESLVRSCPRDEPARLASEAVRAGAVLAEVGRADRAEPLLALALRADAGHTEALAALADLQERAGRWDDLLATLDRLVEATGASGNRALRVRMGRAARMCGKAEEAEQHFEAVLADDPASNEALRQLSAIAQAAGDHARALELLGRVEVRDEEMRFAHLTRLADLAKQAGDDGRLVAVLRNALDLRPGDRRCLTMLLETFSRAEDWLAAVGVIERLAATVEGDSRARAKYFSAAAVVLRDKLADIEGATRMYESVLDEDWTSLEAFEAIDRMLTSRREYKLQEKVYRRMILRVSGKGRPELEVQLWHALGEIYRSRLQRFEEAAEAFAAAARLEPRNAQRHVILAELYTALGRSDDVVEQHRQLLRIEPARLDSLRAIREAYSATGRYDRAFAVVGALAARGQASPPELEFFEQWIPRPMVAARSALDDESWLVRLRHEDEDPYVSGIFSTVLTFAVARKVRPGKDFGLGPATAVDHARQGGGLLAQQLVAVARVFGVVVPQLHVVRQQPGTMAYALTDPPATILGGALTQIGEPERVFLMGRHLAYYQGGRYMAVAYSSRGELLAVLLAAVAAVTGHEGAVPPTARPFLEKLKSWLRGQPQIAERLTDRVRRFLERGGKVDIERWLRGVELTACRAGLLLVADPRAAAAALRIDSTSPASIPTKDRVEDLLAFVLSDAYAGLRESLGVQVA